MARRILTIEQINLGKDWRREGLSNREIARKLGVSKTTVWENVYAKFPRKRKYKRVVFVPRVGGQCKRCEVFLTREIKYPSVIPTNYQIKDYCVGCYLTINGLKYEDLL